MTVKSIKRLKDNEGKGIGIVLISNSDQSFNISNETLRKNCPCASCLEIKGHSVHSKPLGGRASLTVVRATKEEALGISEIWPVGNYAIGMKWEDGHDSGIYTFKHLFELATNDSK